MKIFTWPLQQWITDIATLTGLAGSVITIFVYRETRTLKKIFKRKVGLPKMQHNLNECASKISSLLDSWEENKDRIIEQFRMSAVWAESFAEKSPSKDKIKIQEFLSAVTVKKFLRKPKFDISLKNEKQAWDLYYELCTLISRIDVIVNDMKLD